MKRLRKHIKEGRKKRELTRGEDKLKYLVAGEYGESGTKRPHYHIALFGLNDLRPEHRKIIDKSWNLGNILYYGKPRELSAKGYAYVAQYIQKKIYDERNLNYYTKQGQIAPYNIASLGLGKTVALKNRRKFEEQNYKYADNENHIQRIPRYYIKLYKEQDMRLYVKLHEAITKKRITPERGKKVLDAYRDWETDRKSVV